MSDTESLISDLRSFGYNDESLLHTIDLLSDKRDFIDSDGLFDNKIGDFLDNLMNVVEIYKDDPTEDNKDKIDAELEYFRELTNNPDRIQNLEPIDDDDDEYDANGLLSGIYEGYSKPDINFLLNHNIIDSNTVNTMLKAYRIAPVAKNEDVKIFSLVQQLHNSISEVKNKGKTDELNTISNIVKSILKYDIDALCTKYKQTLNEINIDPFEEEEEETDAKSLLLHPNNTPDLTPIKTPLSVKNTYTMNNFFPDNKEMINTLPKTPTKANLEQYQGDNEEVEPVDYSNVFKLNAKPADLKEDPFNGILQNKKKPVMNGRRTDKNMATVKENLSNEYYDMNNKIVQHENISLYKNYLWDILINGNYRVKFIPKCSVRTSAIEYCKRKFDNDGFPLYRVLPPNGKKDPFGNEICDLNGDQVDDVVIVDKQGKIAIVNGYKLVKASPYKKIWKQEFASEKTDKPFNIWLQEQFEVTRDWNYNEQQWNAGKFAFDIDKVKNDKAKSAYTTYMNKGLGKPKLSTRITARGLWSSIFSKIWQLTLYSMFTDENGKYLKHLKVIFNYMKVCNAVFIEKYEIPLMVASHCENDWLSWIMQKKNNPKAINAKLGLQIQQDYNESLKQIIPINGTIKEDADLSKANLLNELIGITIKVIMFAANIKQETLEQVKALASKIQNGAISKSELNSYKNTFKNNVDLYIDSIVGGNGVYLKYKEHIENEKKSNMESDLGEIKFRVESDDNDEE